MDIKAWIGDLKGWRTLLWNVGTVMGVAGLTHLAGVDWTQYVSPTWAVFIIAGVNAALRVVTNTPVGVR